jgi:hypothetical protein
VEKMVCIALLIALPFRLDFPPQSNQNTLRSALRALR